MITLPRFPVPIGGIDYFDLDLLHADRSICVCWAHGLAEPVEGEPYLICGECGHVYPTERALREDYTEEMGLDVLPKASDIFFCPHCAHDF